MRQFVSILMFFGLIAFCKNSMAFYEKTSIYYKKQEKFFTFLGYPDSIFIDGEISQKTVNDFIELINLNKIDRATVYFNSQGGDLLAGIKIGKIIREYQFNTSIGKINKTSTLGVKDGECYSSCVFAFSGGKYRYMNDKDVIGVHRFYREYSKKTDLEEAQVVSAVIINFLREMEIDLSLFDRMALTSRNMVNIISKDEALRLKLVNNGFLPTKWTLDSIDGSVYLRGYRETQYGEGKLIFICDSEKLSVIAMHSVAEHIGLSGQYSLDVDDEEYRIEGDLSTNNGFYILSFKPNVEHLKQILVARNIGFKFLALNPAFYVGFDLEIGESKKSVNDYIQRCIKTSIRNL